MSGRKRTACRPPSTKGVKKPRTQLAMQTIVEIAVPLCEFSRQRKKTIRMISKMRVRRFFCEVKQGNMTLVHTPDAVVINYCGSPRVRQTKVSRFMNYFVDGLPYLHKISMICKADRRDRMKVRRWVKRIREARVSLNF